MINANLKKIIIITIIIIIIIIKYLRILHKLNIDMSICASHINK